MRLKVAASWLGVAVCLALVWTLSPGPSKVPQISGLTTFLVLTRWSFGWSWMVKRSQRIVSLVGAVAASVAVFNFLYLRTDYAGWKNLWSALVAVVVLGSCSLFLAWSFIRLRKIST
jgi:multisubunit Na+/H+ antiporter MnhB subunit